MMKRTDITEIHALASAELARQINALGARRQQIVAERASLYAHALKNGTTGGDTVVDADERAAREHARHLLNGSAPESLSLSPDVTRDKILYREQRGIDIAVKILSDKSLAARASDAVAWTEANLPEWQRLAREMIFAAIRLDALEDRARRLLEGCTDLFAVPLPMVLIANSRSVSEIPLSDLIKTALAEGVVTSSEIRKAKNVE